LTPATPILGIVSGEVLISLPTPTVARIVPALPSVIRVPVVLIFAATGGTSRALITSILTSSSPPSLPPFKDSVVIVFFIAGSRPYPAEFPQGTIHSVFEFFLAEFLLRIKTLFYGVVSFENFFRDNLSILIRVK